MSSAPRKQSGARQSDSPAEVPPPSLKGSVGWKAWRNSRPGLVYGALLFLWVCGLFLPAITHEFITYDEPTYVTQNPHVTSGLSWTNLHWAWQSREASNWHPLTWLSHMLDCQLFGLNPGGHHLTSVLLHATSCVLLFLALREMTGRLGPSWLVAALFGLHPLHVESVAWIAERKDVLSTVFWMLTLWAYGRRATLLRATDPRSARYYFLALLFFALGLMSKPMLVTLPCVLLLLDYWPLGRWASSPSVKRGQLMIEKLPFFILSAGACAITVIAQRGGGTVASVEDFSWKLRVANAIISYCGYLYKCFFPIHLAIFYPFFPHQPPWREIFGASAVLIGVSVWALFSIKKHPSLLVGWLWFLGTLVPVIGFVQVGGQSMADRYTYVPLVGIFIALIWWLADLTAGWPRQTTWVKAPALALLVGLSVLTSRQLSLWKNGVLLFSHAAAVTENNWVAHANLYAALVHTSPDAAQVEMQKALKILADFAATHDQKGIELARDPAHLPEAIKEFKIAIRIMEDLPAPHYHLGLALSNFPERHAEAIEEFHKVIGLDPHSPDAHYCLAVLLTGRPSEQSEAIYQYRTTLGLDPNYYQAHYNLGLILATLPGRTDEARQEFATVLRLQPNFAAAQKMLDQLSK